MCCVFGPSKKILSDNGTEFKNKMWEDVFTRLKMEHYSHLLTTVQWMHRRLPQVPQGMHWKTDPERPQVG